MEAKVDGGRIILALNRYEATLVAEACDAWLDRTVSWTSAHEVNWVENIAYAIREHLQEVT